MRHLHIIARGVAARRSSLLLLCLLLLMAVAQAAGLHFHVHQAVVPPGEPAPAAVHAQHFDAGSACAKDACGVDVLMADFWKNPAQDWDLPFALISVLFVLLAAAPRRAGRPAFNTASKIPPPVRLRPPQRAPPR